jgi:hypothetical protein
MAGRSEEQVQLEIAAERERLAQAVTELKTDFRSRLPLIIGGTVAAAVLLRGKVPRKTLGLLWKLR